MAFKAFWGRPSSYVMGIVVTAFVLDRSIEIGSEQFWKACNKGVSIYRKRFD